MDLHGKTGQRFEAFDHDAHQSLKKAVEPLPFPETDEAEVTRLSAALDRASKEMTRFDERLDVELLAMSNASHDAKLADRRLRVELNKRLAKLADVREKYRTTLADENTRRLRTRRRSWRTRRPIWWRRSTAGSKRKRRG